MSARKGKKKRPNFTCPHCGSKIYSQTRPLACFGGPLDGASLYVADKEQFVELGDGVYRRRTAGDLTQTRNEAPNPLDKLCFDVMIWGTKP